jgi:hypothetical protein
VIGFFEISVICVICGFCVAGTAYALTQGMELLGRLAVAIGISLVLTLLLLVLYQDDSAAVSLEPVPTIAASATAPAHSGTP